MHLSRYEADLHCHTSASDGTLSPGECVRLAARRGLKALAVTDHDTIEGWPEAESIAKQCGIRLLRGIEINTDWNSREIHILGFEMRANNPVFQARLEELQSKRATRIKDILLKLNKIGHTIEFDEVMQYVSGKSAGRPHIAQAMVKHGVASNVRDAFDRYLKRGCPAYVPRYKLTPEEAIEIIRNAGGVAVIAHPGAQELGSEIDDWVKAGLQGIEVYHPDHSFQENIHYTMLAERLGLVITGGSDFHGPGIKPGIELGDWGVGLDAVEQILSLVQ
jgi:predicted metal-dependent phosphoesterase TrpH